MRPERTAEYAPERARATIDDEAMMGAERFALSADGNGGGWVKDGHASGSHRPSAPPHCVKPMLRTGSLADHQCASNDIYMLMDENVHRSD